MATLAWWVIELPRMGSLGTRIAGAAVYGAAFVALLAFAVWLLAERRRDPRRAYWTLATLAAVWLVAVFSGEAGRADPMIAWLRGLFGWDLATAEAAVLALRKSVHFLFYGATAWAAFWSGWHGRLYAEMAGAYALAFALVLSVFDEARQFGAFGRSGSAWDVALDMAGALAAAVICVRGARRREQAGLSEDHPEEGGLR